MSEADTTHSMPNKCPQCGATLPAGALEGLCPACLLRQGAETGPPPEVVVFQPPSVEEVARLFPQLEVLAFIGKGGMGAVYQARQPALDRLVALKILPPQAAGGPGFAERFNREARALARLNHPHIVTVHEFGQVNGMPFFIMEFVDGLNLRQLEQAGKLSAREALKIVPQICEALQFAHDEGIVHRDIKPENILLDKKGRVKIADFGIAKILGREQDVTLTETKGAIGTPHYMAPEQMENPTSVDHRADIFSLGVVFYEMLTGELPLGKFSPPSSRKVEVDVRLDDVVLRSLEKDPDRRYQHASQVKTAVDTIATTAAPPPMANGNALAEQILARGYDLDIRSCLRRSWKLLRGDFWPIVGITALMLALFSFAGSGGAGALIQLNPRHLDAPAGMSVLAMLVYGPLMGGLSLFYLKKIRGEPTTIETAFSGFSHRFLHLFLAGFVTWLLTGLGFVCLILPGIYLLVAWWFTLTLVADKNLDFWSAMEVSRKVVTRHWWKFFAFFWLVLVLMALGVLALIIGLFVTFPFVAIAATYAYEDIFGGAAAAAAPAPAGVGPSGTVVMPGATSRPPQGGGGGILKLEKPALIALAAALAAGVILLSIALARHRSQLRAEQEYEARASNVNTRTDFDSLVQRVREEMNRNSTRFGALHISQPREDALLVSFSGLEGEKEVDGSNTWRAITGSLSADHREGDRWEFQGQDDLQTMHFDMNGLDGAELVEQSNARSDAATESTRMKARASLHERFEAAKEIRDVNSRDEALTIVAKDAANAEEGQIVKLCLSGMGDDTKRNEIASECAGLLAKHGMRKQALDIAKSIGDSNIRDKTLSDLAQ